MSSERFYRHDHLVAMTANVVDSLRQPNVLDLLGACAECLDDVEAAAYDTALSNNVDLAAGDQLDKLGERVAEQRGGLLDGEFRLVIRAKMLALQSGGTRDEVLAVAETLLGGNGVYSYQDLGNASIQMVILAPSVTVTSIDFRTRFRRMIERAVPLGVGVELYAGPLVDVLRFDSEPSTPHIMFSGTTPPGFATPF